VIRRGPAPTRDDRSRAERDVDAELAFHQQSTIEELRAAGLTPEAAEAEAQRRFGSDRRYRAQLVALDLHLPRPSLRSITMHIVQQSLRATLRDIRHSPGFTLGVVAILTIGLGINALTLGLVDRLVLSGPAGLTAPEHLRRIALLRTSPEGVESATEFSYRDYQDLKANSQTVDVAAETDPNLLFGSGDQAEQVRGVLATANYFDLLGVTPALGRFFTADESEREGARLVVLGHSFWQRRFNSDPAVLGDTIRLEDHRYTIIGVTPVGFTGSSVTRADVFLPLEAASDEQISGDWRTSRGFRWIGLIARLAPGASSASAATEATTRLTTAMAGERASNPQVRVDFTPLMPVRGLTASGDAGIAALVGGVALLVLLIAFANVANLFLARSLRRRDRLALRLALGGSRTRLLLEEGAEGGWLALVGVVVAIGAASFAAPAVQSLLFPQVAWIEASLDLRWLLTLGAFAVVAGAAAAAWPMWQAGRDDVAGWLKAGSARGSQHRTTAQTGMLVVQGALSVLLLVGAGLFVRSMQAAEALDLGIDTDRLLVVSAVTGDTPLPPDFRERLTARAHQTPGVVGVTQVAGTLPFQSSWAETLTVRGRDTLPKVDDGGPYLSAVQPTFFDTTGIELIEGRLFTEQDRLGSEPVAVVNDTMARLYWPGEAALGQCLIVGDDATTCRFVVGVVQSTRRQALVEGDALIYYLPLAQAPETLQRFSRLVIRVAAPDAAPFVQETLRRAALDIAPSLRYVRVRSFDDIVSPQLRTWRLGAGLFSVFGVLALLVATIGLYSVVAFDVEGRRREMGLRAALGATSASLVGLVVSQAVRASLLGVAVGLFLAWQLAPLVSSLLFAVPATDGRTFATAGLMLVASAIVASAIPGVRASRVDPASTLRSE
jgi:predicted permease